MGDSLRQMRSLADTPKNGGFAEYILADPKYVAHIPKGLSAVEAAPLICAGITTYKGHQGK
jgi:D-arabinose 1-dehydrogenase-like Zn-dependent alcohol dehydrogenase